MNQHKMQVFYAIKHIFSHFNDINQEKTPYIPSKTFLILTLYKIKIYIIHYK